MRREAPGGWDGRDGVEWSVVVLLSDSGVRGTHGSLTSPEGRTGQAGEPAAEHLFAPPMGTWWSAATAGERGIALSCHHLGDGSDGLLAEGKRRRRLGLLSNCADTVGPVPGEPFPSSDPEIVLLLVRLNKPDPNEQFNLASRWSAAHRRRTRAGAACDAS